MLPDIGGSEILVIAIVALIVVGPKDLPVLLKKLGQFTAKLRGMASEFRASFDEMARQSELDELRKEVEAMRKGQIADFAAARELTPELSKTFDDLNQSLNDAGVQLHPPMSYQYAEMTEPPPAPLSIEAPKPPRARKPAAKKTPAKAAAPAKAPAKRTPAKTPAAKPPAAKKAKASR